MPENANRYDEEILKPKNNTGATTLETTNIYSVGLLQKGWPLDITPEERNSHAIRIDFRPRGWLRAFEVIQNQRNPKDRLAKAICDALNAPASQPESTAQGQTLSNVDYVKSLVEELSKVQAAISEHDDIENALLDEIRAARYQCHVNTLEDGASKKLVIVKPNRVVDYFTPVQPLSPEEYFSDSLFKAKIEEFKTQFIEKSMLSPDDPAKPGVDPESIEAFNESLTALDAAVQGFKDTISNTDDAERIKGELKELDEADKEHRATQKEIQRTYAALARYVTNELGRRGHSSGTISIDRNASITLGSYSKPFPAYRDSKKRTAVTASPTDIVFFGKKFSKKSTLLSMQWPKQPTTGHGNDGWIHSYRKGVFVDQILNPEVSDCLEKEMESVQKKIDENNVKRTRLTTNLTDIDNETKNAISGIKEKRSDFLGLWNAVGAGKSTNKEDGFSDEKDPIGEFIENELDGNPDRLYMLTKTPDGYVTERGQPFIEFIQERGGEGVCVAFIPKNPGDQSRAGNLLLAFKNPKPGARSIFSPTIRFVESSEIRLRWKGYTLGELSKSYNLTPGEQRIITINTKTSASSSQQIASSVSEASSGKQSTSFEEQLEKELSLSTKIAQQNKIESYQNTTSTDSSEAASLRRKVENTKAKASGNYAGVSAGASGSTTRTTEDTTKKQHALTVADSLKKSATIDETEEESERNLATTASKVSSEVSFENKVEVTETASSETYSEERFSQTMTLANPNQGAPINYNLFQVKNLYEYTRHFLDAKIVIDTGIEMIDQSGITESFVINISEVPEFIEEYRATLSRRKSDEDTRIFCDQLEEEIVRATIWRYLLNKEDYIDRSMIDDEIIDAVKKKEPFELYFEQPRKDPVDPGDDFIVVETDRKRAKCKLIWRPEIFEDAAGTKVREVSANAGALFMDSQVGMLEATDEYLTKMREHELAKTEKMIQQGIFFPPCCDKAGVEGKVAHEK